MTTFTVKASDEISFDQKLKTLQEQDNLEEFYYAFLDEFLSAADYSNLYLIRDVDDMVWRQPQNNEEHIARLHLFVNEAYFLKQQGNIYQSVLVYEKALYYHDTNRISGYNLLDYCLKPLGNNYTRLGDFKRAEEIMLRSIQSIDSNSKPAEKAAVMGNLSIVYHTLGKYDEAIAMLNKALQTGSISVAQQPRFLSELGKNYYKKKEISKAVTQLNKALNLLDHLDNADETVRMKTHNNLGICYVADNKPEKALVHFNKALLISQKHLPPHDREISKNLNLIASFYKRQKDYTKAIAYYRKSLQNLLPHAELAELTKNKLDQRLYPENTFIEIFDHLAVIHKDLGHYEKVFFYYEKAFDVERLLSTSYNSQESQLQSLAGNKKRSEAGIQLAYNLYKSTNNPDYIKKAWEFVELTKASVLRNELAKKLFNSQYETDSLLLQEHNILKQRAIIDRNIQIDFQNAEKWQVERDKLSNRLQVLRSEILHKYPNRNDVFDRDSWDTTLSNLNPRHTIIQFFTGEQTTYVLTFTKDKTFNIRQIDNNVYQQKAVDFLRYFSENYGHNISSQIRDFQSTAFDLYEQLLKPELENSTTKSIVIIPDGILNFLPFDALLTEKTTQVYFEKMPFLIKDFNLSYAYALRIYAQKTHFKPYEAIISGFFPEFPDNHRDLQPLPYSKAEAKGLKQHFHVKNYYRDKAQKNFFLKHKNSQLIHIATHAKANNEHMPPSIEFWDKTLYLPEIYGLEFSSQLLVLSACETGLGQLYKGEGAMSLARGFSYAGVQHLVVSQWRVNDQSTGTLMSSFYQFLAQKNPINKSLRLAQMDYLKNPDIENHKKSPYYWAGFIHLTNSQQELNLQNPKPVYTILWLIGSVIFIGLGFYWMRKIKK